MDENVDADTWSLAATGSVGDRIYWQEKYSMIGRVVYLLSLLEEVPESDIEWNSLLLGLSDLDVLESMEYPPLYDESTIEEINGFLCITSSPEDDENEIPCMSFSRIYIYIERDRESALIEQFNTLLIRLEDYKALNQ